MKNELIRPDELVLMIYFIRGEKVMLDRDLAGLYRVETKVLKQAVKRNLGRFPADFMFILNKQEFANWRSQIVTSKSDNIGLRYPPMAFTEQGVAMLSSVLNSNTAIQVNIQIIRAFVKIRKEQASYEKIVARIDGIEKEMNEKIMDQQEKIQLIFEAIKQLISTKSHERRKIRYRLED
ncbi:MAG TPA: ORF6N domain-containing protein [Bacteroidales bacterium]|nr:ORF6N domain-containing protein [Bacteroidales bacterium]HPI86979.1 ORF6N domain-containing protein [Bacteroidales bacterium]